MREQVITIWRWVLIGLAATLAAGCTLIGESTSPTATPNRPTISFLYPSNNAQVFEGTDMTVELLAQDTAAGIERVELFVDDMQSEPLRTASPVDAATVPVFRVEMNWLAAGVGRHQLTARAYRLDGTTSDDQTIIVDVIPRGDASPPANTPQVTASPDV